MSRATKWAVLKYSYGTEGEVEGLAIIDSIWEFEARADARAFANARQAKSKSYQYVVRPMKAGPTTRVPKP